MRYIGGKSLLLDFIGETVATHTSGVATVTDVFAGSGVVSRFFRAKGYEVLANDILFFSYCLLRGDVCLNKAPSFDALAVGDPIDYLNGLSIDDFDGDPSRLFITNNYAPSSTCRRMYFQPKNAMKIDLVRLTIERWRSERRIDDDEYFYLLATLISAVPYVANITGVYAAYLKHWDIRTYADLTLRHLPLTLGGPRCRAANADFTTVITEPCDLLYADPPYNERDYLPNYHILDTIARYDYPTIAGITGMRPYKEMKSQFCSKRTVLSAFDDLLARANARYVLISYNNEGLLPTEALAELCRNYATPSGFRLFERPYRRYKNKIPNNSTGLMEQLFLVEKR